MAAPVLPPIGDDIKAWGQNLTTYLQRQLSRFYHKTTDDNPSEDGVVLWDTSKKYAVISSSGAFRQLATKHIYICTGSYDGSTAIWKRVTLSTW